MVEHTAAVGDANWNSDIETARVASTNEIEWFATADVVIVGCGGAGISAALQAKEEGAEVIALDRFSSGGSTAVNGGIFYGGGGTRWQREAGVEDSVEDMFQYLRMETQGVASDAVLRRFCENSVDDSEWMARHGVRFASRVYPAKTSYPHTSYYLYHSDSSLCAPYRDVAKPAPRGHRAFMPGTSSAEGYGAGLYFPMQESAEKLGVKIMRNAEVRRLILDANGSVLGVEVDWLPEGSPGKAEYQRMTQRSQFWTRLLPPVYPGGALTRKYGARLMAKASDIEQRSRKRIAIRAARGVVLSTGGFVYNHRMLASEAPAYAAGMPMGTMGDTGAGIRLGQTAGGAVDLMHHCSAWRFLNPPAAWPQGVLVNAKGARFVNEMYYGAAIGSTMVEQHGGKSWLICDAELIRQARQQIRHAEILPFQRYPAMLAMLFGRTKAHTLDALAQKMGFDRQVFAETINTYNRAARGEAKDPFGKSGNELHAFERGPFYAIDMSITAKYQPLPVMTLGGLKVDENSGHVLRNDGAIIAGLYAAGRTAIGICSNIYVSGLSVADCIFSGRRAGKHAAHNT